MKPKSICLLFVLGGLVATVPRGVAAQEVIADIEIGYQTVDVTGSDNMYRTQLNEDDGFVIHDFSLLVVDGENTSGLYDRIRVDASGFGGSPAGRLSITSELADRYRLKLQAHHYDIFSSYPGWANPMTGAEASSTFHSSDRTRDFLDLELELMPGRAISPIIGYSFNELEGPSRTTYHVGQDEFHLASETEETERELRVGIAFQAGTFRGAVIQGWREFEATERLSLLGDQGGGLSSHPVLGVDVMADTLQQRLRTEADTPVTTAYASGTVANRVHLNASYARASGDAEMSSSEMLSGSLVSFRISRFFEGLEESIESRTDNPSWRGSLRVGFDLSSNVTLDVGYSAHHRDLDGWALISTLYLDTLNFSGARPEDISEIVEVENGYERDDEMIDLELRFSDIGPFSFWGGASTADTTVDLDQDIAQVVVPGYQAGSYGRSTDAIEFGTRLAVDGLSVSLDYRSENSNNAIHRTDATDRTRWRGRFTWTPADWITVRGVAEQIESDNRNAGSDFEAETDHYAADLDLRLSENFAVAFAWDSYETESSIGIRVPHDFSSETSFHAEEGEVLDGSFEWHAGVMSFVAGFSQFENEGSLPFEIDRAYARISADINDTWGLAVELENYDYSESAFTVANFDADRFGFFVRWRQ